MAAELTEGLRLIVRRGGHPLLAVIYVCFNLEIYCTTTVEVVYCINIYVLNKTVFLGHTYIW